MHKLTMVFAYVHARFFSPDGDDEGATAVEYSLLAALIAGVCIVAVTGLGNQIATIFTTLISKISIP
jgi:pilus assembly protein Flp/PilA